MGLLQNNSQGGSTTAYPLPARVKKLDNRKSRTLIIDINDAAQKQIIKSYTLSQIIEIVRVANCEATKYIFITKKLQSKNILLTTITVKAREKLKRKGLRANTLAFSAKILQQIFYNYSKARVERVEKAELRAFLTQINL